MRKFKKAEWRSMRVVTKADTMRGELRESGGKMWLWTRSDGNGSVWAEPFNKFPYRNDLHRIMNTDWTKAGAQ